MGVSAIVVTFNRLALLKECLSCLLNQSYKLDYIFVINNNSSDGTESYLNSLHNKTVIVKNLNKNIGGAGGFSLGTKLAYENTNSEYFWLMDDDTMPSKTSLYELCKSISKVNNNFGFLSSNVRWWKNGVAANVPSVAPDWSEDISSGLIKLKEATFVSFFIPRYVVKNLGLPIAEAFIWGDDTEYTLRISHHYPCYFVPNSIVYHKSKKLLSNETIFNENYNRIPFYEFHYRNHLFIDKKFYPRKRFIKDFISIIIYILSVPFKSKNYRFRRIYYLFMGLVKGITFNPSVHYPNKK